MKKRLLKCFVCMLVLLVGVGSMAGCSKKEFELSASANTYVLTEGGSVILKVTTKNLGKEFTYRGSSTKIGGIVEVFCNIDNIKYNLAYIPISQSTDITKVKIEQNEIIIQDWIFDNSGEYGAICPPGLYSIKISYYESEKIYESVLEVK